MRHFIVRFSVKMWNASKIISRIVSLTYLFSREKHDHLYVRFANKTGDMAIGMVVGVRLCVHPSGTREIVSYDTPTYKIKPQGILNCTTVSHI